MVNGLKTAHTAQELVQHSSIRSILIELYPLPDKYSKSGTNIKIKIRIPNEDEMGVCGDYDMSKPQFYLVKIQ